MVYKRAGSDYSMDVPSECELEVLHCSGTRISRTYEHRQLKSHGNSLNCHGKVMEKSWKSHGRVMELYYQISVGTL